MFRAFSLILILAQFLTTSSDKLNSKLVMLIRKSKVKQFFTSRLYLQVVFLQVVIHHLIL